MSPENKSLFEKPCAFVVGPGAGVTPKLENFITNLAQREVNGVVLDADGLTTLAQLRKTREVNLPPSWILTPHSGELARLFDVKPDEIESSRVSWALKAAKELGCIVLLKGYRTLVASPDGTCGIVMAGNSALAKAGTGDVLSGFIGAFLAQGVSSLFAAALGSYVHGRIADQWLKDGKDIRTLVASDLVHLIPEEMSRISRA
jgi:NAD(P)H-hydrate epimerase